MTESDALLFHGFKVETFEVRPEIAPEGCIWVEGDETKIKMYQFREGRWVCLGLEKLEKA